MNWKRPHFWIAATSFVLVLSVALVDMGATSPGPLATVHQREDGLSDSGSCSECHGGWRRNMTNSCLECHDDIGQELSVRDGLHGMMEEKRAGQCALCHSDHHGAEFAIVNAQSFANAGIPDVSQFDHGMLGFPMGGKHLDLECTECHEFADAPVLPVGENRYRGLDQDCSTCHDDAHEGVMTIGCIKCHGQNTFGNEGLEAFEHEFFVPLVGGHASLSCDECHSSDRHTLDAIGRMGRPEDARECAACHESPHEASFLTGVARLSGKSEEASCGVCHESEHTSFREDSIKMARSQHALSGFKLDVPHDQATCADCHDPVGTNFEERYPGRGPDECASCHDDPHGGQFAESPLAAKGCIACHDRQHFDPHTFSIEDHEQTALPLTGTHVTTECEACHAIQSEEQPRTFRGTPANCSGCHEDAHSGLFVEIATSIAELSSPECAECHDTESFLEVPEGSFDHGFWTRFPIDGAHAQVDCQACHEDAHEPDSFGRTFGRVEDHFGVHEGCQTCHEDPHHGAFDGPSFPQQIDGQTGCARCHQTSSFRAIPETFDHGLWTGFPLEDVHASIGCTGCHEALRRPDELGRTWGRALGKECSDCHEDPHAGQFTHAGQVNCSRCHKSGKSFEDLAFHHNWHARFILDEGHEKLACAECHEPFKTDEGEEVIRYRPLGMNCIDCHGVNEDQMLRRKKRKGR